MPHRRKPSAASSSAAMAAPSQDAVSPNATNAGERQSRFRCTVCQQGFTRIDHLKRHQLRHSGVKPYTCIFCEHAFSRCDSLRTHYMDCSKRQGKPIPETDQKGRRRHACELCISMKLRCDGDSPCGSCLKRSLACNRPGKKPAVKSPESASESSAQPESYDRAADLGSIKFLLNGGTDGFIEDFQFPANHGRSRATKTEGDFSPTAEYGTAGDFAIAAPFSDVLGPFAPDAADLSLFNDSFFSFFDGPFDNFHQSWQDSFAGGVMNDTLFGAGNVESPAVSDSSLRYESENGLATLVIQSLLAKLAEMKIQTKAEHALTADLHFLLTPKRIRAFVSTYFKYWHPNCPIIHPPSFEPQTAQLPLVISVIFMGAMYSHDEAEVSAAKRVLDLAELFVFATDVFDPRYEMRRSLDGTHTPPDEYADWDSFQIFQAGYLMVVTQYWAGTAIAKNRAMERRFSQIVKVVRKARLTHSRHMLEDRIHQELWLQKESKVRTMNIIRTLDCAFSFFQNYPCRLSLTELDYDLPCEESLFYAKNPFAEPRFRFNREATIQTAFEALFSDATPFSDASVNISSVRLSQLNLNVLDMFILVHVLYAFINTRMTLLIPFARLPGAMSSMFGNAEDPVNVGVQQALARWRELWVTLRSQIPKDEWAAMSFFKSGYNFWLVAQLLVSKKASSDPAILSVLTEPKCEDKLERLKILTE